MTTGTPGPLVGGSAEDQAIAWLSLKLATGSRHQAEFETWYEASPEHAAAYDAVHASWEAGIAIGRTETGRNRDLARVRRSRRRIFVGFALAAAVLFVVLAGLSLRAFGMISDPPSISVASKVGDIRNVLLADGSRVVLDTDTILNVAFTPSERTLRLVRGRARFDVAHEANRAFTVRAGDHSVVAHGTIFDVAIADRRVTVALVLGSVDVRDQVAASAGTGGLIRRLTPGQGLALDEVGGINLNHITRTIDTRWTSGVIAFDDVPLAEAVAQANRYSAVKIRIVDARARKLRVTGTCRATDTAGLANMLSAAFRLPLDRDAAGNFVLSAPLNSSGENSRG